MYAFVRLFSFLILSTLLTMSTVMRPESIHIPSQSISSGPAFLSAEYDDMDYTDIENDSEETETSSSPPYFFSLFYKTQNTPPLSAKKVTLSKAGTSLLVYLSLFSISPPAFSYL
ncbi:MAG: hypothetical protein H6623_04835 [Bdellovibrionaceae bacterium]|nr:hypothetical protein [Pseudobdellovibrionaceae bacterium]